MAAVRTVVDQLVDRLDLGSADGDQLLAISHAAMARPDTEDKLAGVLLLAEHGLDQLRTADVSALAVPLAADHLGDWNSCDWYCVKVVGPFVAERATKTRSRAVAQWRRAPGLWQRRAAAVSFVNLAPKGDEVYPGFVDLLLSVAEANSADPTRWSQTSVGWLLRELSASEPTRVSRFVDDHPELSTEARKAALAKLRAGLPDSGP